MVRIVLPVAEGVIAQARNEDSDKMALENASGTVLVVDDDPGVRNIVTDMIESFGFRVLVANDGSEALNILDETEGIDILFSDVVMPQGMNGFDLADAAIERHKNLKVLLTSGYPDAELRRSDSGASAYRLIAKPYSMSDINDALNEVLGRERDG